jgi:hypothetical protein
MERREEGSASEPKVSVSPSSLLHLIFPMGSSAVVLVIEKRDTELISLRECEMSNLGVMSVYTPEGLRENKTLYEFIISHRCVSI